MPALGACSGGAADPGTLVVLPHGPSGEVRFLQIGSGRITDRVRVGGEPRHLVRDPVRGRVYVTDAAGDSVIVVDVLAPRELQRVTVGRQPGQAAIAPDGKRLYVTVTGENALATIDLDSLDVSRVPTGARPTGVAVSGDGTRVFVAHDGDGTVVEVDPLQRRRVRGPIPIPGGMRGRLTLSSDGTMLLSGAGDRPLLRTFSIARREVKEIPLGEAVDGAQALEEVYATPDGRFWLAGLAGTQDVVAIPTGGGEPLRLKAVGRPSRFMVAPGGRVLVASSESDHLVEIDLDKAKITRRIRVGAGHSDVAIFSRATLEALRAQQ